MKGKWFDIDIPIFNHGVMVSVDEEDDVLRKRLLKWKNKDEELDKLMRMEDTVRGRACFLDSTHQSVIRLRTSPNKYGYLGTIAHEVFHIVDYILQGIGMKHKLYTSDEAYAYLIGYLMEEITRKLKL